MVDFYNKKNIQSPFSKLTIENIVNNLNNEKIMDINLFNDIEIFFPIEHKHQNIHSIFYEDENIKKLKDTLDCNDDDLLKVVSYFLRPYGIEFNYVSYICNEINDNHILFVQKFILIQLYDEFCVYPFIILLHYIACCLADFGEEGSCENIINFVKEKVEQNRSIISFIYLFIM